MTLLCICDMCVNPPQMRGAIEKELKAANLQLIEITYTKIIQLYETKNSR